MDNKIFLSIAILTYNRASSLENLLNNILPQAKISKEGVQVCISNNGSEDNTREVVAGFQKKYPDLIKYNENKENLGFDANMVKALEMSDGNFGWTFGDSSLYRTNYCRNSLGSYRFRNFAYFRICNRSFDFFDSAA